jgi:hypothetical protein
MAEKHKSKYKKPENTKYKTRKDLKDYTTDDKKGGLNPKSTGEKQTNVLRKTDKEVVDTGDMYVKYNADDRLYKDIEDGEYDPKHAAKILKKRQDKDEKDNEQNIKDKIENLTREGKERLVREYIRRKIERVLLEQPTAAEPEEPVEDIPADDTMTAEPAAEPAAAETPTPPATPTPTDIPAPAAETPAEPVAPAAPEATPEELENRVITNVASELEKEGAVGKIDMISKILKLSMKETDPADKSMFFKLLRAYAIKKISQIEPEISQSK